MLGAGLLMATGGGGYDADVQTYITAVETADGQSLEIAVKDAINAFVVGCKNDGILTAIKASCILAGARTLSGALVPLVGAAPTAFNFASGDYSRKNGLTGNRASLKYLDTNRNNNADPQNSKHLSVYVTAFDSADTNPPFIASGGSSGRSFIIASNSSGNVRLQTTANNTTSTSTTDVNLTAPSFIGVSRSATSSYTLRRAGANVTIAQSSATPVNSNILLFRRAGGTPTEYGAHRVAFYSAGESLDLALLDARVTTLINAIAAAIP